MTEIKKIVKRVKEIITELKEFSKKYEEYGDECTAEHRKNYFYGRMGNFDIAIDELKEFISNEDEQE